MADDYPSEDEPQPSALTPQRQAFARYLTMSPQTPTKVGLPLGVLTQLIGQYESGSNYNALASTPAASANAMALPTGPGGFPQWPGAANVYGALSHGAGIAQFEPTLWGMASNALGLTDFSQPSQNAALNWAAMNYGTFPWHWDQPLMQALQYYRRTGQVPPPNYGRMAIR